MPGQAGSIKYMDNVAPNLNGMPVPTKGGAQKLRSPAVRAFTGIETCNSYEAKNSMGQFIYKIAENSGCCARCCCGPRRCLEMDVRDYRDSVVMHFVRPLRCSHTLFCICCCSCFCLQVYSTNGYAIGKITKQWSGLVKEYFTDADTFGVTFPLDMDVHLKATLIAAAMLIDYMFFEETYKQSDDQGPGMT
ncbi:hypothetical protein HPB51_023596 [Rhipicephalus microplus]|uniref:Phospholipid scramblase n=1 Tax=Rhipicephalus microplus TaxID=6941 RepID=A0A9J6ECV4_RHIMP|nr:hypothetical protein HPB51_023596 [Rhipicephalus microplus]